MSNIYWQNSTNNKIETTASTTDKNNYIFYNDLFYTTTYNDDNIYQYAWKDAKNFKKRKKLIY